MAEPKYIHRKYLQMSSCWTDLRFETCCVLRVNSSPNNKILGCSELKAFADDKLNVAPKIKFVYGRVENIVGKVENVGYIIISFSNNVLKKILVLRYLSSTVLTYCQRLD